jgi:hypothetical protein
MSSKNVSRLGSHPMRVKAQFTPPDANDPIIAELLEMHTYARPAGSKTERMFVTRYLDSISGMTKDAKGNRIIRIGNAPVLWSSHTDTVHKQGGRPRLTYGDGILTLSPSESVANCLGADCTVGVWLMRQMILRGVPGLYIFHVEEEIGGYGSKHIAKHTPDILAGIEYAIALDRRGTDSVISHQIWRTASDEFCDALAEYLGPFWAADDTGTFTDTANYTDLIAECTNLSVGYYHAHSSKEMLDVSFAADLLERLCALDVNSLPVIRKPGDDGKYYGAWGEEDEVYWSRWHEGYQSLKVEKKRHPLHSIVYAYPELICDMLDELGISKEDVQSYVANRQS